MPESIRLNYGGAVNAALARSMRELPQVLLFGEDVGKPGGVFGATRGLQKTFGERVFDTPISESAILGSALGAAMFGARPIVEIMWADFSLVALDQIVNQIANARYVSRGDMTAPLVIRTQQGTAPGAVAQHSQSLEAFYLHTPGIRVAMPSTPQAAFDTILSAVYSDDPVIIIENRSLYAGAKVDVIIDGEVRTLGGSSITREGRDLTIVSWGAITRKAEMAAERAQDSGISVEVLETTWLNPLDIGAIFASVSKTRRLMVVHEANVSAGFGAEVVARVAESGLRLIAPPVRVGLRDLRVPAAPVLAEAAMPSVDSILREILDVVPPTPNVGAAQSVMIS
jgi:pyruvate/2-oxoglutarate/acetoin dehydrogenase E1 component